MFTQESTSKTSIQSPSKMIEKGFDLNGPGIFLLSFLFIIRPTLSYVVCMEGGGIVELHDVLRVAGIGILIAILHLFFESTGKKEFAFFLFFVGYIYMTIELLRLLKLFFYEISTFLEWLMMTS